MIRDQFEVANDEPVDEFHLRDAAREPPNHNIYRREIDMVQNEQRIEHLSPGQPSSPGIMFVKFLTRDLVYTWLDKHAQRSAYFDRRGPIMQDEDFEQIFGAIMIQNDERDPPEDYVLEQSARAIAPAQAPEQQPQGRGNQSDVVDDQGSLDFSISSTSQMPMTPHQGTSQSHTSGSFSYVPSPATAANAETLFYSMSETANAHDPGTNTVPDAALAFASAQQGRTTARSALAFASAPPELQQDNDALLKILAKFESSVHLTKPGPNQANIEKWCMRNELKLLENTACPDAVRV